jgi:hypothetical protein
MSSIENMTDYLFSNANRYKNLPYIARFMSGYVTGYSRLVSKKGPAVYQYNDSIPIATFNIGSVDENDMRIDPCVQTNRRIGSNIWCENQRRRKHGLPLCKVADSYSNRYNDKNVRNIDKGELNYMKLRLDDLYKKPPKYNLTYLLHDFPPYVYLKNTLLRIHLDYFHSKRLREGNAYKMFLEHQRLRWAFKRLLFHWYGFKKKERCVNEYLLSGEELAESEEEIMYLYGGSKKDQSFATTMSEFVNIVRNSLTYQDHHSQWITSTSPKNPYTNKPIPQYILYYLLNNYQTRDRWIRLFQGARCNLARFKLYSEKYRIRYGIQRYCQNPDNLESILDEMAEVVWEYCKAHDKHFYHPILFCRLYNTKYLSPNKELIASFLQYYMKKFLMDNGVIQHSNMEHILNSILRTEAYLLILFDILDKKVRYRREDYMNGLYGYLKLLSKKYDVTFLHPKYISVDEEIERGDNAEPNNDVRDDPENNNIEYDDDDDDANTETPEYIMNTWQVETQQNNSSTIIEYTMRVLDNGNLLFVPSTSVSDISNSGGDVESEGGGGGDGSNGSDGESTEDSDDL